MKKVLVVLAALTLGLGSCKKEEICNCGDVESYNIFIHPSGEATYYLTVESECSEMVKTMSVTNEEFIKGGNDGYICLENQSAW